jgi:hypothetical protein
MDIVLFGVVAITEYFPEIQKNSIFEGGAQPESRL